MQPIRLFAPFLAFWLFFTPAAPVVGETEPLLDFVSNLETFSARFEQLQRDPRGERMQFSSGQVMLARPGQFRWVYERPYVQELVSDGEWLWVFDPDLEQATRKPLTGSIDSSPIMVLMDEKPLDEAFEIEPVDMDDEGAQWFRLRPREEVSDFAQVLISVDAQGLSSMRLIDTFENATQVRFFDRAVNEPVDIEQFDFQPPEGVEVVEGR
ncbi:MAG: outer membrane lipoprotein chaperone LolA [Halothiobacillaceae bacterium]